MKNKKDYYVTVCDKCLTASCFHGDFICEDWIYAGITIKKASELNKLGLEHSSFYSEEKLLEVIGEIDYID